MTPRMISAGLNGLITEKVRDVPDFPEPGVLFRDITPLLADGTAFSAVVGHLADVFGGEVDVVAGIEARGFLLAAPLAAVLGVGVVAVRKVGKLPPPTLRTAYDLEYGSAEIEVSPAGLTPGARVVLIDDVLATGGTAAAACRLLEEAGTKVTGIGFLIELLELGGRDRLPDRPMHALVSY
ncbi:adenine phosphoribosyltransferase [Occultella kanbiaonis]|uniref:adenine phosphoribosyltransferase n=1 Tax=Occultella kanbiaonis TaxID=2675754 RepID=UPI0013D3AE01|nr:adenine phosphoribosyltransferase [Occultella kanbiaonis]